MNRQKNYEAVIQETDKNQSMDSQNLLPSHNIKLEPACETDHVHSSAKVMTTETQDSDMIDSNLSVTFKIEPPEVDGEYQGQESMDSQSLLPSDRIKLKPACETDHVHSSAKEMTTEIDSDMIDSNLSVTFKIEPREVDGEYPGQVYPVISVDSRSQAWSPESIDSNSLLPCNKIKLEPACETDHDHNCAKDLTAEVQNFDMVHSKLPVNVKIEQPEVDVECPVQETLGCTQEHPQIEKMMYGNMDFVKQELSDVLCEDESHKFGIMVDRDLIDCRSGLEMTGCSIEKSKMTQNSYEALQEHEICSHISEKISSIHEVNTKLSLTNKNCQIQNNVGMKTGNKSNMDNICHPGVNVDSYLNRQKRIHTDEKPHKYDDFDTSSVEAENLQTHVRAPTIEKFYKCDHYSASFTDAGYLKKNKRKNTREKLYECEDCSASFTEATGLKRHKRTHTGERPFTCDDCGASFSQAAPLKTHKRMHTGEKPYKCDTCDASFTQVGNLVAHKRTHTGEKLYKCDDCGVSFAEAGSLRRHKRTHTGEKPYKCYDCGASFTQAGSLKSHMRTHTGEKPYKCDDCGASFTQPGSLKMHKRTHTGERPFKCDDCSASFSKADSLKTHKRTHTGERPFKCDDCGASFSKIDNLKIHKRIHTGERPYKCNDCSASFTEAGSLTRHRRTHTGERPYKCDKCDAYFTKANSLNAHKRTHTGESCNTSYSCDAS